MVVDLARRLRRAGHADVRVHARMEHRRGRARLRRVVMAHLARAGGLCRGMVPGRVDGAQRGHRAA